MKLIRKILFTIMREEVPQLMLIVFISVGLVTTAVAILTPLQIPEAQAIRHYKSTGDWFGWLFILVPTFCIPLAVGFLHTLYRLWRPSSDTDLIKIPT